MSDPEVASRDSSVVKGRPSGKGFLRWGGDRGFLVALILIGSFYVIMLLAMLAADLAWTSPGEILKTLSSDEIQYSIRLSLMSCTVAAILSVWVAVPIGYLMSRFNFFGKGFIDAILDIPIVLPPLVVGLSLLILFSTAAGDWVEDLFESVFGTRITYQIPSVVLAQFMVACAFAVRTMRTTFDQISVRQEDVALTLGCSRFQAFWKVTLPEARNGLITALTLAWARSLGEFGPILVFSGATRMKTEVLPTTVHLELTNANLEGAVAVSILMVVFAVGVLFAIRHFGSDRHLGRVI